jgi:uncharacterized 2Fe-2S/4Fe-4S cluster protein (DUF4445 family)
MHRVVFTPSGLDGKVADGTSVLDAARLLGVDLDSVCGGRGLCGRCQVVPSDGAFAKWAITSAGDALTAPGSLERDYHGSRPLAGAHRLGCAARIVGDVVIDVPAGSQVHRQVVAKDLALDDVVVDPGVVLLYIEVEVGAEVVPTVLGRDDKSAAGAAESVLAALAAQHGVEVGHVAVAALQRLHAALAAEGGAVTVAVRLPFGAGADVVAVWPGYVDAGYGVAIDVGSTTVAGHLCDLATGEIVASAGRMNPQIRFGEDLMSRVSFAMMNRGGAEQLTASIHSALDELVSELAASGGVARDRVLDVVLVGNPIMVHIALGIDPTPLGQAPFVLATADPVAGRAADVGLDLPFASAYVAPCIAGHVGADTSAAMLAEGPHRSAHMQLLVDVGTNAEIVLGSAGAQYAASSPTGPAFEGAQISCGQRATAGAIERVRIDPHSLEPRFKVIGVEPWSDEAGFEAAIGDTRISGVCGSGIVEAIAEMFLAGVVDTDGVIVGDNATRSTRVVSNERTFSYVLYESGDTRLAITQNDVRAVQLAKAALRAGIDLLLEHAGVDAVADVRLAGAFGARIDPLHAMVLGMVPDAPIDGVRAVGNAAGAGAVRALLSQALRREMECAAREVVKIETATEPRFQQLFVAALAFPHATAPSTHLASLVALPDRAPRTSAGRSGRRRNRGRPGTRQRGEPRARSNEEIGHD